MYAPPVCVVDMDAISRYFHAMKNITLTVEDEVARWAEVAAAKADTNVAGLMARLLERRMREEAQYEAARRRFMGTRPALRRDGRAKLPTRDELHDREMLR